MGKGVGGIKEWISYVKRGTIIVEVSQGSTIIIERALLKAQLKLPIKSIIYFREIFLLK